MKPRFARFVICLGIIIVGGGCGSSKPSWMADQAVLRELVQLNPELDANRSTRRLLHGFVTSAVTLDGAEPDASYKEAKDRTRVAFDSLHAYFSSNAPPTDRGY